jgi:hypothetical protein
MRADHLVLPAASYDSFSRVPGVLSRALPRLIAQAALVVGELGVHEPVTISPEPSAHPEDGGHHNASGLTSDR